MAPANMAELVTDAWDRALTLSRYGDEPLTVGWWHGQAFVKMWDYRTGSEHWQPFQTARTETPPPQSSVFESSYLWERLK